VSPSEIPSSIQLLCGAAKFTLEALAVEGEAEAIPRFSMLAYTGEPLRVDGWRHPVVVDLEGLSIPSRRRPVRVGQFAEPAPAARDGLRRQSRRGPLVYVA